MKSSVKKYISYILVFLAGALVGVNIFHWKVSKSLSGTYRYDIEVKVIDANNGEPISGIRIKAPEQSSSDLFAQVSSITGGGNGVVGIEGIAYEPREWLFSAEGYKIQPIVVDKDSESRITIKLELEP